MASIKKRKSTFSVIYWYLDNAGERKQKWDTLETKKEAKQRKAFVEYYQEKYGYVIVPLEEQFARQIDELKKELDCIFVSQYVAKDFQNLPVGTDELVLVTSLDHPLADQLTVSFADIDGQDFVLSADDFDYETGKLFRLNHITPNVRFRINEDYTAIKMVEQGFGITVLPKLLLHNIPFNVCVRSFTEHFRRNLSVAYQDSGCRGDICFHKTGLCFG